MQGTNEISDEEGDDAIPEDKDYMFPDPDEAEGTKKQAVGMRFDTLDEAHRFVNVYG